MFKLKHQDTVDFSEWVHLIYVGYMACVVLIIFVEIITIGYLYGFPHEGNLYYWEQLVLFPAIFYILSLFITFFALKYCEWRNKAEAQAYTNVTAASIVVFFVAYTHYYDAVICVIFVFPLLAALFFIDIKPLVYAYVLNVSGYLFIFLGFPPQESGGIDVAPHGFVEIITMVAFLTACFAVAVAILRMLSMLVENIAQQRNALKQDAFTALFNHTAFYDRLREMVLHKKHSGPALILWDIDNFKQVNDLYGHGMGDQVILAFAESLRAHIKTEEYGFRYGGEEFGALTWRDKDEALQLAENVRKAFIEKTMEFPIEGLRLTACAGVGVYTEMEFAGEQDFFIAVDNALYHAKRVPGKDTACLWNPEMRKVMATRRKDDLF